MGVPQQIREYLRLRQHHRDIELQIDRLKEDLEEIEEMMDEKKIEMGASNRLTLAMLDGI